MSDDANTFKVDVEKPYLGPVTMTLAEAMRKYPDYIDESDIPRLNRGEIIWAGDTPISKAEEEEGE